MRVSVQVAIFLRAASSILAGVAMKIEEVTRGQRVKGVKKKKQPLCSHVLAPPTPKKKKKPVELGPKLMAL